MSILGDILRNLHQPLLIAALSFRLQPSQRKLLYLVILLVDIFKYAHMCDTHATLTLANYGQCAGLVGAHFVPIKLLLLTPDPLRTIRQIGSDIQLSTLPLLQRLQWGASLAWNHRGIGMTTQVPYVPPHIAPLKRGPFIAAQIRTLILHCVRLGVMWGPIMYFKLHTTFLANQPPAESLLGVILYRVVFTVVTLVTSYTTIDIPWLIVCILGVGSGYSEPKAWPPQFGYFSDATTLRRAWGRCWHQVYRTPFLKIGEFVLHDTLRIKRGTNASSYGKLYIAFALSALMHAAGDYGMYRGQRWFSLDFFLPQAVGITLEDGAIALFDRSGAFRRRHAVLTTWIGYAWVLFWFSSTLPQYSAPYLPAITS